MEVHAHTHTARKKWTHYFWEFLMLFLAVFCGFLAEYQLEHKIEREKGRQYIRSFYKDLTTDTSTFNRLIKDYEIKISVLNGRQECFDSLNRDIKSENCFWTLMSNLFEFPDLIYTDMTIQQLKNAGGLRLIKPVDADSILMYDNLIRLYLKGEATAMQEIQTTIRNTLYALLNHQKFSVTMTNQPVSFLYDNNRVLLNRFFNELWAYTEISKDQLTEIKEVKNRALSLINYLKKKYNLK